MELYQLENTIKQLSSKYQEELFLYADYLLTKSKKENLEKEKNVQRKPKFGCMKGLVVYMTDDFDAPLECFNEYM